MAMHYAVHCTFGVLGLFTWTTVNLTRNPHHVTYSWLNLGVLKRCVGPPYAAELLSAAAATDSFLPLVVTLYEVRTGPLGTEQLKQLRDQGWNKESLYSDFHYFGCKICFRISQGHDVQSAFGELSIRPRTLDE